jgi:hypothetical protein
LSVPAETCPRAQLGWALLRSAACEMSPLSGSASAGDSTFLLVRTGTRQGTGHEDKSSAHRRGAPGGPGVPRPAVTLQSRTQCVFVSEHRFSGDWRRMVDHEQPWHARSRMTWGHTVVRSWPIAAYHTSESRHSTEGGDRPVDKLGEAAAMRALARDTASCHFVEQRSRRFWISAALWSRPDTGARNRLRHELIWGCSWPEADVTRMPQPAMIRPISSRSPPVPQRTRTGRSPQSRSLR